jgi:hypothetical protein
MDEEEDLRGGGGRKRDRPDLTSRGRGGSGPNRRDQENRPEYEVPRGGYFFLVRTCSCVCRVCRVRVSCGY